jgi:polyphenol oxidase
MITNKINNLLYFQFQNLSNVKGIKHFTSTRQGGVSKDHLSGLNLGYTVNDNPADVDKNHDLLSLATNIPREKMVFPKQTNGTNVAIVHSLTDTFPDTDALITNIPGICIGIRTADCVPILLYEPDKKVIAAVHSGWKGTVEKISKKTIELMVEKFRIDPKKIIAGIGPSIGPKVYEIGHEVIIQVKNSFGKNQVLKNIAGTEKAYFDLWTANKLVLEESGVLPDNIEIAGMCTYSDESLFYSARRNGKQAGRLASGIMMV